MLFWQFATCVYDTTKKTCGGMEASANTYYDNTGKLVKKYLHQLWAENFVPLVISLV